MVSHYSTDPRQENAAMNQQRQGRRARQQVNMETELLKPGSKFSDPSETYASELNNSFYQCWHVSDSCTWQNNDITLMRLPCWKQQGGVMPERKKSWLHFTKKNDNSVIVVISVKWLF